VSVPALRSPLTDGGRTLSDETRDRQEPAFAASFENVRLHDDSRAHAAAQRLQARAFTCGNHVWLGRGESERDVRLMTHELTHVIQQARMPAPMVMRDSLQSMLPEGVEVNSASISFQLPGPRILQSGEGYDMTTTGPTTIRLTMERSEIQVRISPAVFIDAQWPVTNMEWSGLLYDFESASVRVLIRDVQFFAIDTAMLFESFTWTTGREIGTFFTGLLAGTPIARPGYDPFTDPDPVGTLQSVASNWVRLPSSSSAPGESDVSNIAFSVSAAVGSPITEGNEDGQVVVSGDVTVRLQFAETLSEMRTGPPTLESLGIVGSSIVLRQGGEDVARLEAVSIRPGGRVTLERWTILGGAPAQGSGVERLLRELVLRGLLQSGNPDDRLALGSRDPDLRPTVVPQLAARLIEEQLTQAVTRLVRENATVIPGFDLRRFFGISE
jgi:hypothetical protein